MRTLAALTALLISTAASAAPIPGLFSTGVDNTGVATTGNGKDLHWTVTQVGTNQDDNFGPRNPTYTGLAAGQTVTSNSVSNTPDAWLADSATSRWITNTPFAGDDIDGIKPPFSFGDGFHLYRTTFSLAGFNPATASFKARFLADDIAVRTFLNGSFIGGQGRSASEWLSVVADASTFAQFLPGENVLHTVVKNEFFAYDRNANGTPAGFRFELLSSNVEALSAVPEPTTWAMLIIGFGMVGVATRRRRTTVAA